MAQSRAFASIGPMLWNQLPLSARSTMQTGGSAASSRILNRFQPNRVASDPKWEALN
jgi:hypothetical protein